jgi:hypothetical protein
VEKRNRISSSRGLDYRELVLENTVDDLDMDMEADDEISSEYIADQITRMKNEMVQIDRGFITKGYRYLDIE